MKMERFTAQQSVAIELLDKIPGAHDELSKRMVRELCEGMALRLMSGDPIVMKMLEEREEQTDYNIMQLTRSVLFVKFVQCEKCESTSGGAVDPSTGKVWCRTWGEFVDPLEFCSRGHKRCGIVDCPWR